MAIKTLKNSTQNEGNRMSWSFIPGVLHDARQKMGFELIPESLFVIEEKEISSIDEFSVVIKLNKPMMEHTIREMEKQLKYYKEAYEKAKENNYLSE